MKKIVFLLVIAFTLNLNAQSDDKAKALLDEVYNKVKGYDNVFIDFKYVLDNAQENIHQETRGDVTLEGEKYRFNYLGATKIFDGSKTYTIIPENEEVVIEGANGEEEATITPSKMLTFYKDGYNFKWDITQDIKGRKIQYVELVPIDSSSEIKQILLGIDTQTKHIYNLIEVGLNGTKTTITVNSFKTDQPISESLFTFDRPKYEEMGYYIINN
ncbi:outer membrane lipoprotein carrier protein LolA [Robertkochia marina]|uniref:Outer membrane lipoprotein carrier protein LolA n=1 Tax=Robertkochia marina TaxID=1227945 RepID=A0A4S3M2E3_9FLAO|nr:outer membrane lipoprotein carrier protein LolA [Robertkochia marina]THD67645.1 outer membrane lipoprotein carrier protein LolA [Robertkochia marina]TRZ43460.1 outer membrane lipoprotein carrier protein LolA [Robertkochia marina]